MTGSPILYEDDQLLLVAKPSGALSHPNPKGASAAVAFEGQYDFDQKTFVHAGRTIWLLHRLDQDTSGVLLAAKDEKSARILRHAFEHQGVKKTYLAVVRGNPGSSQWQKWEDHLEMSRQGDRIRVRALRGKPANAELKFRNQGFSASDRVSLLEIELITGRTHQIRVQAASRQHPLAGDDIYGDFAWNKKLAREKQAGRLQLHAWKIAFRHPHGRHDLVIEARPPEDFWIPTQS